MPRRRPTDLSRRRVLAVLAAGSAGLAGCSTPEPGGSATTRTSPSRTPTSTGTDPTLVERGTRWAPDYESAPRHQAGFLAVDTDAFLPPLADTTRDYLSGNWATPVLERPATSVDTYVRDVRGWGHVYYGVDGLVDGLRSKGYERDGSYQGFDWYVHPEGPTVGVDGTTVLVARFSSSGKAVLDVARGDRTGAMVSEPAFARLVRLTESREYVRAFRHRPSDPDSLYEGRIGRSDAVSVSEERFELRTVMLFEEPGQVDADAIRKAVSAGTENHPFFTGLSSFEVSASGRHAVVTGSGPVHQLYIDDDWSL